MAVPKLSPGTRWQRVGQLPALHSVSLGKESLIISEKEAHLNYCLGGWGEES